MSIHILLVAGFILCELGATIGAKVGNVNLMAAGLFLFGLSLVV